MTTTPRYLTGLREGRLIVYRSDGKDITEEEREWFRLNMSAQLRTDALMEGSGNSIDAVMAEPDRDEGVRPRTDKSVPIHPLINRAKGIILKRGWRLAAVSTLLGRRPAAVSTWFRGQATPSMQDTFALFGLAGYKLVPVPIGECLAEVEAMVRVSEEEMDDKYHENTVD